MSLRENMADLPLDDVAAVRNREWNNAATAIMDHVLAGCPDGCSMSVVTCSEGERLAEAERSAWQAYRVARFGEGLR